MATIKVAIGVIFYIGIDFLNLVVFYKEEKAAFLPLRINALGMKSVQYEVRYCFQSSWAHLFSLLKSKQR